MDAQSVRLQLSALPADSHVSADGRVLCSAGELLTLLGGPVEAAPVVKRKLLEYLNIRAAPDVTAGKLGVMPAGTVVGVIDRAVNGYYKIAEQPGYIASNPAWSEVYVAPAPPPVIVVPPAKPRGGYGAHVMVGYYDARLADYPIIKSLNDPAVLVQAHGRNPAAACIYRRHYDFGVQDGYLQPGPQVAANRWLEENRAAINAAPFAYHEGLNEVDTTPEYIEFEYQRVQLLAALGVKACVLNTSVTKTNDDAFWHRSDVLRLVNAVQQAGGAIGVHMYAQGVMSASTGPNYWREDGLWTGEVFPKTIDPRQCWLALRCVRDREILHALGFNPTFFATECGIDDCSSGENGKDNGVHWPRGIKTRGWKSCIGVWRAERWLENTTPEMFYKRQLDWWAEQSGILGAVYAHGDTTPYEGDKVGVFDTRGVF